ncbi:hypothetical protein [Sphingobium quisquiliarum]|nr:hypothetical protein [Sphingobium quisquiliarum]
MSAYNYRKITNATSATATRDLAELVNSSNWVRYNGLVSAVMPAIIS